MMRRWMRSAIAMVAAALLAPIPLAGQGTIAGTVVDSVGTPIGGVHVRVMLDRGSLAVITSATGRFSIAQVPAGRRELDARKLGFHVATLSVTVSTDSTAVVNVRLRALSQVLPGVVIAAEAGNVLSGVVIDTSGAPVAGATAELIGLRMRLQTGEDGRFAFYDLPEGVHLLQWRKEGYRVAQRGVTMVPGLQRDFAITLRGIGRDRYTAARAADVAQELDRRRRYAGSQATVIGRDELARFGKRWLGSVLGGRGKGRGDPVSPCFLINGYEPTEGHYATMFRADEVEMVEIYPVGSENSRSLCGRFPPRFKGCTCLSEPSGYVIWLRTN
jgi:hypothetical protein